MTVNRRTPRHARIACAVAGVLAGFLVGCVSSPYDASDTSIVSSWQNPDRVWSAIEQTLSELGYDIVDSNRFDGRIHASGESDGATVELDISQVVFTEDQVKVFIKPRSGGGGRGPASELSRQAARDFAAALTKKVSS